MGLIQSISNFIGVVPTGQKKSKNDASGTIFPAQLQRIRQDISTWRASIKEAEQVWYPHRVKVIQMYQDTILNGHVSAVMEKRYDLTLLRDYKICNEKEEENTEATKIIKDKWFRDFMKFAIDSLFFGYSAIQICDILNGKISGVKIIKRENISPDRLQIKHFEYSIDGISFDDERFKDWVVYIDTPNQTGSSNCGFGLLYKIAFCEIFLRNCIGYNGDFVELFAMPYRVGKTNTRDEAVRAQMEETLKQMGSAGYAVIDPDDQIELLESALGGNGYKAYDSFQDRLEKTISKIALGHGSAMDAIQGKLGNSDESIEAVKDKQKHDNQFVEQIVNTQLIPRLRNLGFSIPEDNYFKFNNDEEKEEMRQREDESNKATADIVKILSDAGLEVDPVYVAERTGIPVTKKPIPEPVKPGFQNSISDKLNKLYGV